MTRRPRSPGFTLVELLVVLAIIGLLVALLLPGVQQVREAARRTNCRNNLHQLVTALHSYEAMYLRFPAGIDFSGPDVSPGLWSWQTRILPFMEAEPLYLSLDQSAGIADRANREKLVAAPATFRCPSDPVANLGHVAEGPLAGEWPLTNYLGVSGSDGVTFSGDGALLAPSACDLLDRTRNLGTQSGMLFGNGWIPFDRVEDGTGTTLLIGERGAPADGEHGWISGPGLADACPNGWTDVVLPAQDELGLGGLRVPVGDEGDVYHWWSHHPGGTYFGFVDANVRWIAYTIDPAVFQRLSTRAGGELVELPSSEAQDPVSPVEASPETID